MGRRGLREPYNAARFTLGFLLGPCYGYTNSNDDKGDSEMNTTKTTAHSNCTHSKTKAARALCRKTRTASPIAPLATDIQTVIDRRIKTLSYETAPCYRCSGSGKYGPNVVANGKCFACGGLGYKFTKAADKARAAYREMMAAEMNTPLADLQVGDSIYCTPTGWAGFEPISYQTRWYKIASIEITENSGVGRTDEKGQTTWLPGYKITFERTAGALSQSAETLEGIVFPRYDAEKSQRVMQAAAKLKGVTVTYYEG